MPDLSWLQWPAWLFSIAVSLWLVVRSAAWALQIRQSMDAPQHPYPTNGASAEWRGESRKALQQLESSLRDSSQVDRQTLDVLREVRDELRSHNEGAHQRHQLVKEIHQAIMRRRGE